MSRAHKTDHEEETCSMADSSIDDNSGIQELTPIQTGTRPRDWNCQS